MTRQEQIGLLAAVALAIAGTAAADGPASEQIDVDVKLDSGFVENPSSQRGVVFSKVVHVPGAAWIRLRFDEVVLGEAENGGRATMLSITSLRDGAEQRMGRGHLAQWRNTTAYFNGDAIEVAIVADPGAGPSRVVASRAWVPGASGGPDTICGTTDDRVLSDDPRAGRIFPGRCTVWIADCPGFCLLTAGHCESWLQSSGIVEFNVPLSNSSGDPQHPGPEDQYFYDPVSLQGNGGQGVGNDWAFFGCLPNPGTNLTPFQAQGGAYALAATPPPVAGQDIRITGFGSTSPPVPNEWNRVQKTHVGPYWDFSGTTIRYRTDTSSGNSGSAVVDESTGEAIGIHTHGGCTSSGGSNIGTGINHAALQDALADPRGVCAVPACLADINGDGVVDTQDLLALLAAWGPCPGCPADINGDGVVDTQDLLDLLAAWGPCV